MWRYLNIYLISAALLLLSGSPLNGQSMIDLTKEEVRVIVKDKHMEFRRDKAVVNQQFNYLKYINGLRSRTWIIYFTDEDICRSSKLVCDYGEYDEVLEELNESHEKVGESEWTYQLEGDTIQVILARQEWYFTVREARKK
ncbi:MAG: hypothetical protein IMY68_04440 [Bacteroidetes bacterium]|nr:hypothetical protein [Bacteroidota bacterium]